MEEIWKPIPNYPRYEVSNFGRVRSYHGHDFKSKDAGKPLDKPNFKKLTLDKSCGYLRVGLFNDEGHILALVHQLVLEVFICPRPEGMESCHNDGNRLNNHVDNLRWDTRINNFADRDKHGQTIKGEKHHNTKLTINNVIEIRLRASLGESCSIIAQDYNVSRQNIGYIVRRQSWKHI